MNKIKFINSNLLKILAIIFMLLDHLWATIIPGNQWMTNVGRLAFPIFAFLIVEGFTHTSDLNKYIKRLFIFALISEIPFNLIYTGSWIFPFHQNVMFTLLLGLLCISEIDKVKNNKEIKSRIKSILKLVLYLLISIIGFVDYGITGVLTIIVFYIFKDFKYAWLGQLISLIFLYIVFFKGQSIVINIFDFEYFLPLQSIGILSLIPIWLYNGKKGKKNKLIQYTFYCFYPVHMLAIYLIYYFVL
ncbi:MAG: conjugal transfer protein TraX [Clostridia bacterium]|nr:conjugal transfer protein TraX [Clostridia bacterium]